MYPFGLIHDMNCIETFFLKKRKTSKGQSDISALSNTQQRCSQSKIPSPMSWMGLEQGKHKPQLEIHFRTKSRATQITWAGRDPSCTTAVPLHSLWNALHSSKHPEPEALQAAKKGLTKPFGWVASSPLNQQSNQGPALLSGSATKSKPELRRVFSTPHCLSWLQQESAVESKPTLAEKQLLLQALGQVVTGA